MSEAIRFTPVRGTEEKLSNLGFHNGYLYFATDTKKIFLDYYDENGNEINMANIGGGGGSGNSGIFYANKTLTSEEKTDTSIVFPFSTIEGSEWPAEDDIIINTSEGSLYRVILISRVASSITATRLTIAGSGGGSSSLAEDIDLNLESLESINLINGKSQLIYFTATSAKNAKGVDLDNKLTITYTLSYTEDGGNNYTIYKTDKFQVNSGVRTSFDFGQYAKKSASSKLTLKASQNNSESTISRSAEFTTSDLKLSLVSSFSNASYFTPTNFTLSCNVIGSMDKRVEYYVDDMETPIKVDTLASNSNTVQTIKINELMTLTHGYHSVKVRLFQLVNGEKGTEVDPLSFEVAIKDETSQKPIIWLGDYKTTYYNYDTIQIPFYVYNPANASQAVVYFKHNGIELDNSPQTITDFSQYSYFEIADAELNILNKYSISCGEDDNETVRNIELTVIQDPNRADFGIQKTGYLIYKLDTVGSGRSNSESETKRQTLVYQKDESSSAIAAKFTNFNWYNNGWTRDSDNKTCLRISNGAKLSIPIGQMVFADPQNNPSHTIEIQFKIRNVQDYSNLIRTITRYVDDEDLYEAFYNSETGEYNYSDYTNYDSFLAWYLKNNHISFTDATSGQTRDMTYDDLEFSRIEKQINLSNIVCEYYSGNTSSAVGLCLGPQDAFFSNGTNTVSVSYVEDQVITLSAVYKYSTVSNQNLMYLYLNGVLTGVIQSTKGKFTIESNNLIFNSNSCDIDLYKVRVYNEPLTVNDIVMNYAADFEDVDIYDQNKLAEENRLINEYQFSYENMIQYNQNHPNEPLMPYIIFDTSDSNNDDKLSYAKSVNVPIKVEFVNTGLELAYTSGELEELAKEDGLWADGATAEEKAEAVKTYYTHHCPSWTGYNINMAVQGTSSEFYPRRNYKLKTKTDYDEDETSRVHIFLNRGPYASDYAADIAGLAQAEYIKSNSAYDSSIKYYSDNAGENEVTFDSSTPYEYNTYYIKNPAYIKLGKEKTRQKFWYMDNYTAGTTKFTMKVDFMESSGSYNMGFANLVNNAYSKHPLKDYSNAGAFQTGQAGEITAYTSPIYDSTKTYYYYNHKGNISGKTLADFVGFDATNEAHLAAFTEGPLSLEVYLQSNGLAGTGGKVLGGPKGTLTSMPDEATIQTNIDNNNTDGYNKTINEVNKWYNVTESTFQTYNLDNDSLKEYRTSVQGFRTLAFHKKSDGTYQFIGMYNMLLDKGSDECYGFKPEKTTGKDLVHKFANNQAVSDVVEAWEFSNNSRTFCSFRDPLNRKDLSFNVYTMNGNNKVYSLNSVKSSPVVTDSFEYRYHKDADMLDYIYDPIKESDKHEACESYEAANGVNFLFNKDVPSENQEDRINFILDRYKNWEKACQWVWSTCIEKVQSQGTYTETRVGTTSWAANTFYILDENNQYVLDSGASYDSSKIYYKRKLDDNGIEEFYTDENNVTVYYYIDAHVSDLIFNSENKLDLFTKVGSNYIACTSDSTFDESAVYYILNDSTEEELENKCDRLVKQCQSNDVFDADEVYYIYDGTQTCGNATTKVEITEEEFNANKTNYYVGITVSYGKRNYKYDTQEYRADKFVYELEDHFDLEYMATYFVMTEVFECYDSRGKNCMMASWGPQEEGGEYIWYPIFYDIDTQLGVNNTGIPSFEYNVDATEDGNYSTSDSVLWNNFYKFFKSSAIISKYKHLRGVTSGVSWTALKNPPIKTVDNIESWYNTDPDVCDSIAMRGERPLVAVNLDEYYKYITITNSASYENGVTGHIQSNTSGEYTYDQNGTYFYMLQGNRALSRCQFLTNRLEYIDSWLNQGDYQRGGANRIAGRIAANNSAKTSDAWVETADAPYYDDDGNKNHLFDAEYWVNFTPTHSSYVTLGDDNEAYPSQRYDGIHPLKFNIDAIETGVRTSANYPEQLLYIYGMNQMKDLGDMSNLYWQEFRIEGNAQKLTSLKLGYDGLDEDNNSWFNNKVNQPSIPASKGSSGMPLLKEVNMCNMQINTGTPTLDLTSCEKLENFRATGSNFTDIKFAEGVALNTLYLPSSITSLELTEAQLLKNLITNYTNPVRNSEGNLEATPGLYIQGLFEGEGTSVIGQLNILNSGLGYNSYKLLNRYYTIRNRQTTNPSGIQMTKVQWSPYELVNTDDIYDSTKQYYQDNGHYGLEAYSYNLDNWSIKVANNEIYRLNSEISSDDINQITDIAMLERFIESDLFRKEQSTSGTNPVISGIIYVNNNTAVDEYYIRNTIQPVFPDLTFFFNNVNQAYTAKFLLMDDDEGNNGTYQLIGSQTIESGWFSNPVDIYGDISRLKANHDFLGWAETNSLEADIIVNKSKTVNNWDSLSLDENVHTYYFYAICPIHSWTVKFYDQNNNLIETKLVEHNTCTTSPTEIPWKDDSELELEQTYKFLGYNRIATATSAIDLSTFTIVSDTNFYAIFDDTPISVYDNINEDYFEITNNNAVHNLDNGTTLTGIGIKLKKAIKGKLTIPCQINGVNVITFESNGLSNYADELLTDITHIFFQKNSENKTTVCRINGYCFYGCTKLRYFEFANGLIAIGERVFQAVNNLNLMGAIGGETLTDIGDRAFVAAFNPTERMDLIINGTIDTIGSYAFSPQRSDNRFKNLIIGSDSNRSKISNFNNCFSSNIFDSITYYPAVGINMTRAELLASMGLSSDVYTDDMITIVT